MRHVLWLNQHDWGPGRAGMNAELVAAEGRYPNLEVIDWNAEVAAHPDEVYADSIHLTPSGQTGDGGTRPPALRPLRRLADAHDEHDVHHDDDSPTSPSTTRPTRANAAAAAAVTDDDSGSDTRDLAIGAGVVLVVVLAVVSVWRRAARRAGRGARRDP